jgi:hypothetical protein
LVYGIRRTAATISAIAKRERQPGDNVVYVHLVCGFVFMVDCEMVCAEATRPNTAFFLGGWCDDIPAKEK